ncbi:MATE family efflux transporter [Fusibacter sp. JL216-2]|uniref:MATE family efflux transporter n=1 Tax=Fusibacter sp. JL216-2 TaxID=3071453 RepID=UPI003D34FC78
MDKRSKFMGEENIKKVLLKLSVPGIIGMLITAIYNIVDTLFIGMMNDTSAIGAVSVAFPLIMLIGSVGQMFGVGANSYISRLLGSKDHDKAESAASTAFITTILVALVFTIIVLPNLEPVLKVFGATKTIMPYALSYGKIMVAFSVFTMINMTMNNMIRAEGGATFSMLALSLGAIINMILDPIFIFTLNMGIEGAAIATIAGQVISTVFLLSYYFRGQCQVHLKLSKFEPTLEMYSEIFKIGIPTLLRQVLVSLSLGLINSAAMVYGDQAVAAMGVSMRVLAMSFYVTFGYLQGFMPVVGYNYGAKLQERVKTAISFSIRVTSAFNIFASLIFIVFATPIMGAFSSDPQVIAFGAKSLRYQSIMLPFFGYMVIGNGVFQAFGKGREAMLLSVARQGIFLIPAITVLPRVFGVRGILLSQPVADFLTLITTYVLFSRVNKSIDQEILKAPVVEGFAQG